ncbi:hypothetical protein FOA52_000558 [Chlamydomonas sp. UWO 241]|nr:hypothetical protein FOA52_000558 [Chlamydomonas sp. UWO 241]
MRWPAVKELTLVLVVGRSASDLAPLATTTLAGLKSLAVRQACPDDLGVEEHLPALDMALSNSSDAALDLSRIPDGAKDAIAASGAIPLLVQLLVPAAADALGTLAGGHNLATITAACAIPALRQTQGLLADLTVRLNESQAELAQVKKELAQVKKEKLVAGAGAGDGAATGYTAAPDPPAAAAAPAASPH